MTSVLLSPEDKDLTNGEIVDRIDQFITDMDVEALIAAAVRDVVDQFITVGAWRPSAFTSPISGVSGADLVARQGNDSILRRSVRIPVDLHDLVKDAAAKLGCTNGVIIRSAVSGADLSPQMSPKLPALDADKPGAARRRGLLDAD